MKTKSALPLLAAILCALPLTASGTIRTWDDGGADANFSTAANWSPDGVPANGDDLVFPAAAPATVTNDLSSRTFDSLSFPAGVTLAGNAFTLTGGITLSNSGAGRSAVTITANITLGANQTFDCASGGSLNFDGSVLFGARTLTVTGARPCTFNGTTGSATAGSKLIKTGTGLLRVTTNAFTNLPWDVSNGTLDVDGILQATVNLTGGKLTGDGTLTSLNATGGDIEPDAGDLSISGQTTLGGASRCLFHITGPATENRLSCGGLVDIAGSATIIVDTVGYTPVWDEDFQFITKTLAGPITGTFSNAADNSELPLGGTVTRVHYNGGNGNDLTLDTISTTRQWDGGDAVNDNWNDADNWTLNTQPNFGDVLVFPSGIQSSDRGLDNNFPNDTMFRQLIFNGDDYTLTGNPLILSNGIILEYPQGVDGVFNLDTDISLARDQTFEFRKTVNGGVTVGIPTLHGDSLDEVKLAGHTLTLQGKGDFDCKITGNGGVTLAEHSFFTMDSGLGVSPNNTYTGETLLLDGSGLYVVGDDTLGSAAGPTRLRNASLTVSTTLLRRTIKDLLILEEGATLKSEGYGGLLDNTVTEYTGGLQLVSGASVTLISTEASCNCNTPGIHEISGTITGSGNMHFEGPWKITGSATNTFTGGIFLNGANLTLTKSSAGALAVSATTVQMSGSSVVTVEANEQINDAAEVRLNGGVLKLGESAGRTETITSLSIDAGSHVRGATGAQLVVLGNIQEIGTSGANASIEIPLRIEGTPCIVNSAAGTNSPLDFDIQSTVTKTGVNASILRTGTGRVVFGGAVSVACELAAGVTVFNGTNGSAAVMRLSGGTLGGTGTVGNILSQAGGGTVAPGQSTGTLKCRTISWNAATNLITEVGIANLANGYDVIQATGSVTLGNAGLQIVELPTSGITPGFVLTILENDGSDAIVGTFANLPEGAYIPVTSGGLIISYHGGTGNDVTLTKVSVPPVFPKFVSVSLSKSTGPGGQDQVSFTATGSAGAAASLEASTDLTSWAAVQSVNFNNSGNLSLTINQTAGLPRRFFRLRP